MRCFAYSFMGMVFFALLYVLIRPQYADFRARAEIAQFMISPASLHSFIAENIMQGSTYPGQGVAARVPACIFRDDGPSLHVSAAGALFIKGGRMEQALILVPERRGDEVEWLCTGAPRTAMPHTCREEGETFASLWSLLHGPDHSANWQIAEVFALDATHATDRC